MLLYNLFQTYFNFIPRHASPTTGAAGERLNSIPERLLLHGDADFFFKLGAVFNHYQHHVGKRVLF